MAGERGKAPRRASEARRVRSTAPPETKLDFHYTPSLGNTTHISATRSMQYRGQLGDTLLPTGAKQSNGEKPPFAFGHRSSRLSEPAPRSLSQFRYVNSEAA